jgi:hypothetical protein
LKLLLFSLKLTSLLECKGKGKQDFLSKLFFGPRELESELDAENRRLGDAQKNLRRSERRVKELTYTQDEDRKNHERMQVDLEHHTRVRL